MPAKLSPDMQEPCVQSPNIAAHASRIATLGRNKLSKLSGPPLAGRGDDQPDAIPAVAIAYARIVVIVTLRTEAGGRPRAGMETWVPDRHLRMDDNVGLWRDLAWDFAWADRLARSGR
ncbi:hypothetical protein CcaCcLH18_04238 [Colletotrichum camelliae]|nr:hypothetical protein CcaCcLH18_04238 [Colletotrichum camelliae]